MYLALARINNYRNLRDVTVDFNEGLTVLVGENNIGKTNVIEAIRLALGPSSTGAWRQPPRPEDLSAGSSKSTFTVSLTFCGIDPEDMAQFIDCLTYDRVDPSQSSLEIHYSWTWNEATGRSSERRWGGSKGVEAQLSSEVLQSIPFVYLEPLRDALATLTAGRSSRIGALVQRVSAGDTEARARVTDILGRANRELQEDPLVGDVEGRIQARVTKIASRLAQRIGLRASTQDFPSVANSLRLVLAHHGAQSVDAEASEPGSARLSTTDGPVSEIRENGLGYNNVLYIATVLADLTVHRASDFPILCVEEPEAHLHPQLQLLLGEYMRELAGAGERRPQVILTTHSPNLASQLPLKSLNVLHRPSGGEPDAITASPFWFRNLDRADVAKLERLIDATKASLFFARAVILVEGICEQLLIPPLARLLGIDLGGAGISVIPVHGLPTGVFSELFGTGGLQVRCAIVTDGDPSVQNMLEPFHSDLPATYPWLTAPTTPARDTDCRSAIEAVDELSSGRSDKSLSVNPPTTMVFRSRVTLEYDLAAAGDNALVLAELWRERMGGKSPELTARVVRAIPKEERATYFWQGVCLASQGRYKAQFAQELADALAGGRIELEVPPYLRSAFDHVMPPKRAPVVAARKSDACGS